MDGRVTAWTANGGPGTGQGVRCPACGYDNLIGADVCDNCGADIWGRDVPEQATSFQDRLMGEHLIELGAEPPVTVGPDTTVDVVVRRMLDASVDCVLVLDHDRLVGIFTDRDAVVKTAGKRLEDVRVGEVMTPDPVVLRHDDPIAVAIHKMAVGGYRHIPITQDGRPTGVVTARDVFHHLATFLD